MQCVFQLMDVQEGVRSHAFQLDRVEFAKMLANVRHNPEHLVLVLAEQMGPDDEFRISGAPVMRVETFCSILGVEYPTEEVES